MCSSQLTSSAPTAGTSGSVPTRPVIPVAAAAATIGAAATDLAVLPGRFQASGAVGVAFLVVGVAQLVAGGALLRHASRRVLLTASALGLGVLAYWVLTRTTGWSAYAWWSAEDGAIGFTDWICAAVQALSAVSCLAVVWRRARGPSSAGFDVGEYLDQSSRVQALVDMFGPPDLEHLSDASSFFRTVVRVGFGTAAAGRRLASPIRYVAPGDPPMLILYGTEDTAVPARQYVDLTRRLTEAKVQASLVAVSGAGHGLNTPTQRPTPA